MAFFACMKLLGIGPGDEILLTGFTCSVMANAVWRIGATPVYADIDPATLGTDPADLERKITARTRMIVAQHSFGIPCAIDTIATLTRSRGIFLLEDSAISIGSTLQGRKVGAWGDAAIFSTDHGKPINTVTGGLLYTADPDLAHRARELQGTLPGLDAAHQRRLWSRFQLERRFFHPRHYALGRLLVKLSTIPQKLRKRWSGRSEYVLLEGDFKPRLPAGGYAYPARLPEFLAELGLGEVRRWPAEEIRRKRILKSYLAIATELGLARYLPAAYFDSRREIVPLRFVYTHPRAEEIVRRMAGRIDVEWIWFREPIICAPQGAGSFGYAEGACPQAEATGRLIVNWPCIVPADTEERLLQIFREVHADLG
jgi:dTDP-4-amino-4,6-dideoxygalactose transaminase